MPSTVDYHLHVHFGFVYLEPAHSEPIEDFLAAFGGQANGICGAAYPGVLAMTTGLHTGTIPFTVTVAEANPFLSEDWEDVVEVSFTADRPEYMLATFDTWTPLKLPTATTYRARYCTIGMDPARDQDTRLEHDPVLDRYELQLWPAPWTAEKVVRVGSSHAAHSHRESAGIAPPPLRTEAKPRSEATRSAAEERQTRAERQQEREIRDWGGIASDHLRAVGPHAHALARENLAFSEQLVALGSTRLRQVALWAARSACDLAGSGQLNWDIALNALAANEPLPAPFDNYATALATMYAGPLGAATSFATSVTYSSGSAQERIVISASSAALAAVFAASEPDPATAAFAALAQAVAARDDPGAFYEALRREFELT